MTRTISDYVPTFPYFAIIEIVEPDPITGIPQLKGDEFYLWKSGAGLKLPLFKEAEYFVEFLRFCDEDPANFAAVPVTLQNLIPMLTAIRKFSHQDFDVVFEPDSKNKFPGWSMPYQEVIRAVQGHS